MSLNLIDEEYVGGPNPKAEDKVNHPSHYTWLKNLCGIEVIDITRHMGFNLGNVVKYVLRAGHKSEKGYSDFDKEIEDLKKAKWYLEDEIKFRSGEDTSDQVQINTLKKKISEYEETVAKLTETIHHLKSNPVKGVVKLSKKEIQSIYDNMSLVPDIIQPIIVKQSGGSGVGLNTKIEYNYTTEENKVETFETDITDYAAW